MSKAAVMTTAGGVRAARAPRAEALKNRERLLEAAKAAFAEAGSDASLEDIARRAGVGIATLYRNFPTRDAVVEAVYRREVQQMADAATDLLAQMSAGEALHEWMRRSLEFVATKKGMGSALGSMVNTGSDLYAFSIDLLTKAVVDLVNRAIESGDIRPDVDPTDILRAMTGFSYGAEQPGWKDGTLRLVDILMDGLRARPSD